MAISASVSSDLMEDPRTEHARLEAEGWGEFEDALSRVPDDRLTAPGVLEGLDGEGDAAPRHRLDP